VSLDEKERRWFALDGKELRGSIETGSRRGEALVQAVGTKTGKQSLRITIAVRRDRKSNGQAIIER